MRAGVGPGEAWLAAESRPGLMPAYRVTLAYDGTDFEGWQTQTRRAGVADGALSREARTVQGVLEDALARLAKGEPVVAAGAGRTDAGVHALGQVASFDLPSPYDPAELARALNGLLPVDVRVVEAAPASSGFHARKSALAKVYRYVLDMGPVQVPTRRRLAGHVPWRLEEGAVRATAALFVGRHDFAAVASTGSSARTTVRTVTRSEVLFEGDSLTYEVEADGFLRKMVRSLVGGLIATGRGVSDVETLRAALVRGDRRAWPAPADACGLTLVRVVYPPGC